MSNALDFLTAEREHAERHLARVRRIQARMQSDLEQAGLDEVTVYERLAAHQAYRELQRDEVFYQQMWLRIHRQLDRLAAAAPASPPAPRPVPVRTPQPQPTRNGPCPCGSTLKYKRCCGKAVPAAA